MVYQDDRVHGDCEEQLYSSTQEPSEQMLGLIQS